MRGLRGWVAAAVFCFSCAGGAPNGDAGHDAGANDAGVDGGHDAGDVTVDAGHDAGVDAGQVDGGHGGDGGVASACEDYAKAYCARAEACAAPLFTARYETRANCVASHTEDCVRRSTVKGSNVTSASVDACRAGLAAFDCYEILDPQAMQCPTSPGTVAAGGECFFDGQCRSGKCARMPHSLVCGMCEDTIGVGGTCNPDPDHPGTCAPGLVCVVDKCQTVPVAGPGEDCRASTFRVCGAGLRCENDVCVAKAKEDAGCTSAFDGCSELDDLFCNQGVCSKVDARYDGGCALPPGGGVTQRCRFGEYCGPGFICTAPRGPGETCDGDQWCKEGLACLGGECLEPSVLSCGGGERDAGPNVIPLDPFHADIPPGGLSVTIACDAGTSFATFTARYFVRTGSTMVTLDPVVLRLDGGVSGPMVTTPATQAVNVGPAIATQHRAEGTVPTGWCGRCGELAQVEVLFKAPPHGNYLRSSIPTALTCTP